MKFCLLVCFFCVFSQVVQATVCEKVFTALKFFAPKSKSIIEVTDSTTNHSIQTSRTNLEQELKDQGWTADYYRGLNDLTEWVAIKKKLQALKADPYKTHIEYFAKKVEEHIAFATKEMSRFASDEQKTDLALLKAEAKKAILEEKVTYEWWVNFHIRLSTVLTKKEDNVLITIEKYAFPRVQKMISGFPEIMLIPTPLGFLGFMTFNRAFIEGVYPVGLISRKQKVDGFHMNPKEFFFHDTDHVAFYIENRNSSKGLYYSHKKMLDIMKTLPLEKRKLAELIYFIVIHENPNFTWYMPDSLINSSQARRGLVANRLVELLYYAVRDKVISKKMIGLNIRYIFTFDEQKKQQIIRDMGIVDVFMEEVYDKVFIP